MSDLIPAAGGGGAARPQSLLDPLRNPSLGTMDRVSAFAAQPPVRKALPWFAGVAAIGLVAIAWAAFSTPPQRVLYASLGDSERAGVVEALDKASINYTIDNATGALTVAEGDLYKARMLVASENALAMPQSGAEMLDSLPMGASRTLEGDRLRAAQERELTLTVAEIDGVEAVRVHLARPDRSVFVRDDAPPSASVMVRMAPGRQLADSQVTAIANLVAASVPGLTVDAVRIVDQHGRLLSEPSSDKSDRLNLQSRMEDKLRAQVAQLLTPMIGEGNFSSEIQVDLDMNEVTSARESYDKDGSIRRETEQQSQTVGSGAVGVPGVLSNSPPPPTQVQPGAPLGTVPQPANPTTGESSATRTYELGREVAVSNNAPGNIRRLTVAVALSKEAMKGTSAAEMKKLEQLIGAAVGIDPNRGDQVAVMVRPFEVVDAEALPFWETSWFAMILRNGVALVVVLLVLLLAVRPLMKALTGKAKAQAEEGSGEIAALAPAGNVAALAAPAEEESEREKLAAQIDLARRIVREKPDDAVLALKRMLAGNRPDAEAAR
ncbi:flagellar M-ring protein FliF [Croceibacterium sp. LX-88]|jgi:flagellar M-ring protein FliF|uniref:Flagellar M-ring protein n=1 Tax=Croceibacterium selenioxidans TaxID=2838833 RepID=A0ABS5W094_9SPHN|nr:flagellar basal-body MS-ring/collar protein FliF [Croceibacterium selenioxidans]MBT2133193.1 flagellar M-ring protein FliF [Croceibacterium selenioxidans]